MEYLYHRVPKNMTGNVLYPLNTLKKGYPDIYAEHVKKYRGRSKLLLAKVPPLKCLWNDVLHLTAIAPAELRENLAKAGIKIEKQAWYRVPVNKIKGAYSIAFIYRRDISPIPNFKKYETFDPKRMSEYRKVPAETIGYYKRKKREGVRPLLFHLVPHVLYKGEINTRGLKIITI